MTPVLDVVGVTKRFAVGRRRVLALDDVSLRIARGGCHAIVGESGSGKSTLANVLLGVYGPSEGAVLFDGRPLPQPRPRALRRAIQLVQQNPSSALNPRRSVAASIRLALDIHRIGDPAERPDRVIALLSEVGLSADLAGRSPGSLSGGEKQRVAIARALACGPEVVVLDEPTSALDVLVQAQVLDLLAALRAERGLTYVFITHDLAVVRTIADRVSVFRAGRVVEEGPTERLFADPADPYTRALIAAIPVVSDEDAAIRDRIAATLPQAVFDRVAREAVAAGAGLVTVTVLDRPAGLARRVHASDPQIPAVSDARPVGSGAWARAIGAGRTFVADDAGTLADALPDGARIAALGYGSAISVPVADAGGTVCATVEAMAVAAGPASADGLGTLEALVGRHRADLARACKEVDLSS